MNFQAASPKDIDDWIALAREVEHLFGPMADVPAFQTSLRQAIDQGNAFCARASTPPRTLQGGIVISRQANEIVWLAVSEKSRGKGFGKALLQFALSRLNRKDDIFVQTFDKTAMQGQVARKLYESFGFVDLRPGGLNPAGAPTVIMQLSGNKANMVNGASPGA